MTSTGLDHNSIILANVPKLPQVLNRIVFAAACALLGTSCSFADLPEVQRQGHTDIFAPPIKIEDNTFNGRSSICFSAHIDDDVWNRTGLPYSDKRISDALTTQAMRIQQQRKVLNWPEKVDLTDAFQSDSAENNVKCRQPNNIRVRVTYTSAQKGSSFIFTYVIEQNGDTRSNSRSRDIEEEWRSGKLELVYKTNSWESALIDDLTSRAYEILLDIEGHRG